MSVAFNRLITQFRDLGDLNVDMSRKDHTARAERPSSRERFSTGRQMFINLGSADGFDKGKMLGYVCGVSGVQGDVIGRMLIKDVYSFVDVEPDHFEQVFNAFKGANYKGRKVRVDEAQGPGAGPSRPQGDRQHQGGHRGGPHHGPRNDRGGNRPHESSYRGPSERNDGGFAKKGYYEPKPHRKGPRKG
ncbi:MAG: DbpA RNA binding domain-containing protein [Flavobacteriales bacterium]|nr:DbpA RNA binding domain-containing protein [Flavobacteriales bacterium]